MKIVRFYMERTSLLLFTATEKELWIKSYNLLKVSVSEDFHNGQISSRKRNQWHKSNDRSIIRMLDENS